MVFILQLTHNIFRPDICNAVHFLGFESINGLMLHHRSILEQFCYVQINIYPKIATNWSSRLFRSNL